MKNATHKKGILRRTLRFFLKLFAVIILLIVLAAVLIFRNLKPLALDIVRSRYPDLIINVDSVQFRLPLGIAAKGIYLRHIEDTSGVSAMQIPELDLNFNYNASEKRFSICNLTIMDYSMTIDRRRTDTLLPFIAFAAGETEQGQPAVSAERSEAVGEIRLKNGTLSIVGLNYDIRTKLNMSLRASVKESKGYDVSGSLKDFKAISYAFQTRPLHMEFETSLKSLNFDKPLDIGNMQVLVNRIPANLTGQIEVAENGYKVTINATLDSRPVRDILALIDYRVPGVSDFDIQSPAEIEAEIVYDPDIEEFIKISGLTQIEDGKADSKYYGVTIEGLRAFLPFKYIGTINSYLWVIGGNIPEHGVGNIFAGKVKYDRYSVENLNTGFVYDGMFTQFLPITAQCYGGTMNGGASVLYSEKAVETELQFDITGLDIASLLHIYEQKRFNITGKANGRAELNLFNNYIKNINVRMKTEDGIFTIENIEKSIAALPGGEAVTEKIKREMGKPEYWEEFVKALRNYPYEEGKIDVGWESQDQGSVKLDLWLKGKKPKPGTMISFPIVPITIGYHGIQSITDLFNIDEILENSK